MEVSWIRPILFQIMEEWNALPKEYKPWGVQITLQAPLAADDDDSIPRLGRRPHCAWFLADSMEMPQERNIWAFIRFWIMHFERSWDKADCASRDPRFAARCYPLGLASFAPYTDSQDLYVETMWGGLWGFGRRLTLTTHGSIEPVRGLWIA